MKTAMFEKVALSFFSDTILEKFKDNKEYGFNNYQDKELKKVGYCINLTMKTIKKAVQNNIDLILTHHNIWEEYFELREDCLKELQSNGLIHFYCHLPLDSAEFGPSRMLVKDLLLTPILEFCYLDELSFGVISEYEYPIEFKDLKAKLELAIGHSVRGWKNNNRLIKRVGIVAGSGGDLEILHEAKELGCDAYITGEKKLKTLLYAEHIKMNFLLGSHTFTEKSGIEEYARLIKEKTNDVEFVYLQDEFIE